MEKFNHYPVGYNQDWPRLFDAESRLIQIALGNTVARLHHIGSSAVPGLMAKPIIDILGESENISAISQKASAMNDLGFDFKGEYGISQRAYFSRTTGVAVHVHIFPVGHFQIEKHLFFRDYLRTHPEAMSRYQMRKEELLKRAVTREEYQAGKNDLIRELTMEAYRWKKKVPPSEL
jgi:GrpB-like predicted nucleotidyltransferase (UPF0157 family)